MKGYKVDFTASTITITADFAKKMNAPPPPSIRRSRRSKRISPR